MVGEPAPGSLLLRTGDIDASLALARIDPGVRYLELDKWFAAASFVPNDPMLSGQSYLSQINVPAAWDASLGSTSVDICFLDPGIRTTHESFQGSLYLGGYDFVNNDANPSDDFSHGTHVAALAVAGTDDGIGMAGVALSLCGPQGSAVLADAVAYADEHGALLIAAAGNAGPCYDCVSYPARYDSVVAVGCVIAMRLFLGSTRGPDMAS